MTVATKHDPDICGLSPDTDCPACLQHRAALVQARGNHDDQAAAQWEQLARRHPMLRDAAFLPGEPPPALDARQLLAALMLPQYRAALQEVLAELVSGPVGELVAAILKARRAA